MIKRQFRTEEEFKDFFFGESAEKEYIYDNIVDSIEIAMFENLETADFAEIIIAGETIGFFISIFYSCFKLWRHCRFVNPKIPHIVAPPL